MAAQTNFIDIATIWLHAGKGGDGAVSLGGGRRLGRTAPAPPVSALQVDRHDRHRRTPVLLH